MCLNRLKSRPQHVFIPPPFHSSPLYSPHHMSVNTGANRTSVTLPRILQWSVPGLLDSSQPSRILRHPDATLAFAMFDPLAATGQESPAPIYPCDVPPGYPKRIVIETLPKMGTTWRFVESAARAPGMSGEGSWPRLAMVCG